MKTNGFRTSSVSIARVKTPTKSNLGKEVVSWLTLLHHSPSTREVNTETVEGAWRSAVYRPALYGLLSLLFYINQDQVASGGTAHSGLDPTIPVTDQDNVLCVHSGCHELFRSP